MIKKKVILKILVILLASVFFPLMFTFSNKKNIENPIITNEEIIFLFHNNYAKSIFLKSNFDNWRLKYPFTKKRNEMGSWDGWWELKLPIKFDKFQLKKTIKNNKFENNKQDTDNELTDSDETPDSANENKPYTYKFVVDGEFIADPLNPNKMEDGMGNLISYFHLKEDLINYNAPSNPNVVKGEEKTYRFIYKSYKAKQVFLVGNFNHWNPYSNPMISKRDGIWETVIKLPSGKYYYNFVVDDKWVKDPLNTNIERNVLGRAYSVFKVKD
ncbi:MAG: hypothetical protein OEV44_14185 [Spirochaetota bacterium]|nr:hypothetical protein [Spirochaetota bacterium]